MPDANPIAWRELVRQGNVDAVRSVVDARLLHAHAPCATFNRDLRQALVEFAKKDRADCLTLLLQLPESQPLLNVNRLGTSPLTHAILAGSAAAATCLLREIDLNPTAKHEPAVLKAIESAAANGHVSVLQSVLNGSAAASAHPGQLTHLKKVALFAAVREGRTDCLRALLAMAAPTRVPAGELSPLILAAQKGHLECLRVLLPLSDSQATDSWGKTAMHWAAREDKSAQCLDVLLDCTDWQLKDSQGDALLIAAVKGASQCVSMVLKRIAPGAHTKVIDHAMVRAFTEGHVEAGEVLLARSTGADATDYEGHSAFMGAVIRRHERSAREALRFCDPKKPNWKGETALMHLATHSQHDEWFETVLAVSDADARDEQGRTAFDWALGKGRVHTLEALAVAMNELGNSEHATKSLQERYPLRPTPLLNVKLAALREQAVLAQTMGIPTPEAIIDPVQGERSEPDTHARLASKAKRRL